MLPRQLRNLQDATCVERSICRGYPQSADTRVAADGAIMNKAVSPVWPKRAPKTKKGLSQLVKNIWHPHRHMKCFGGRRWGDNIPDSGPCRSFDWMWAGPEGVWAHRSCKTNSDIQLSDMCFCTSLNLGWIVSEDFGRVSKCRVHEDMTCLPEHSLLKILGGLQIKYLWKKHNQRCRHLRQNQHEGGQFEWWGDVKMACPKNDPFCPCGFFLASSHVFWGQCMAIPKENFKWRLAPGQQPILLTKTQHTIWVASHTLYIKSIAFLWESSREKGWSDSMCAIAALGTYVKHT